MDLTNRVGNFGLHDLFTEIGWKPIERLRLVGGMRLSRLPSAYRYRSDDFLNNAQIEREVPVDDRNLLTGRVAALWSLDPHQIVKLIWGTAAQDNDQIQFSEPERIATTELVYVRTGTSWTLSGSCSATTSPTSCAPFKRSTPTPTFTRPSTTTPASGSPMGWS